MVTASIVLQLKRQVWHVERCEVAMPDGATVALSCALSPRKFLSQEAAIQFLTGHIFTHIREHGGHAITTPLSSRITIQIEDQE